MKSIFLGSMILAATTLASSHAAAPAISLQPFADGLVSPTCFVPLRGTDRILIGDQVGVIYSVPQKGGAPEPWFDLRPRLAKLNDNSFDERGLLGLALHPDFAQNGRLFAVYSAPIRTGAPFKWDCMLRLSEFKVANGKLDESSEKILLDIDKPYFNHNGGPIAFGPDNMLYFGVGDGGNGNDLGRGHAPGGNGQNPNTLLGKILRLDVSTPGKYTVPKDNPFKEEEACAEIWAYGIRNPWRMTFDRAGQRELFVADIGQDNFEEVDIITKGGNYGWPLREGFHPFDQKNPRKTPESGPTTDAAGKTFNDPAFEYRNIRADKNDPNAYGISITGGYVYRGKAIADLAGKYIFGDWSKSFVLPQGVLLAATRAEGKPWTTERLEVTGQPFKAFILSFGEDEDGELYVLTNGSNALAGKNGKVQKLIPAK